jgi:hypothetical protein
MPGTSYWASNTAAHATGKEWTRRARLDPKSRSTTLFLGNRSRVDGDKHTGSHWAAK